MNRDRTRCDRWVANGIVSALLWLAFAAGAIGMNGFHYGEEWMTEAAERLVRVLGTAQLELGQPIAVGEEPVAPTYTYTLFGWDPERYVGLLMVAVLHASLGFLAWLSLDSSRKLRWMPVIALYPLWLLSPSDVETLHQLIEELATTAPFAAISVVALALGGVAARGVQVAVAAVTNTLAARSKRARQGASDAL